MQREVPRLRSQRHGAATRETKGAGQERAYRLERDRERARRRRERGEESGEQEPQSLKD